MKCVDYAKYNANNTSQMISFVKQCTVLDWRGVIFLIVGMCDAMIKSPMDAFKDDESFKKVIRKCLMFRTKYDGKLISDMYLRKILKIATGVQGVSNFRPTAAAAIYEKFGGNGVTWDMSCGWGGRLLGALMSKRIHTYIGTDPSILTYRGLGKMRDDFSYLGKKVELHCLGSEAYLPQPN